MRNKNENPENPEETKKDAFESALDRLNDLAENGGVTISGRIYRITTPTEQVGGRPSSELVGTVEEPVDDDYIGRLFGSGKFKVRYLIKGNGRREEQQVIYTIGREYDQFKRPSTPPRGQEAETVQHPRGGLLDSFFQWLTPEKIGAFAMSIKTFRELFPPKPQPDYTKLLLEVLAANKPQGPALSDTIVLSAMESLKQPQKQPSVLDQIHEFKKIADVFKSEFKDNKNEDEDEDEENGDTMKMLMNMAISYLPTLLKQNNNNYQAVGAQVREMPIVKDLVSNDPELAYTFFEKAKQKLGAEKAKELAKGFGLELMDRPEEKEEFEEEEGGLENG